MNSSDKLPLPITTSWILQRVAGFFSSTPDVVKENSYCSRPQTLGKKLQPSTQIKAEKKRKKSNAFTLLRRRPMTTSRIVAPKKIFQDQVPSKTIHTAPDLKP
jgi:hypothetical protein